MHRISMSAALAAIVVALVPAGASAASHGALLSSTPLTSAAVLPGAAKNLYVTYSSTGVSGQPVTVSGTIAIPKGKAPKGGWPVFSWAHGSTGIADVCAPSADTGDGALSAYSSYIYPFLTRVLKAGFVVVRTDYEGLGTPGDHPYLIGTSEGRSVLDIVRAARKANPAIGNKLVIGGHSQGGGAALWAASLAKKWTPEEKLGGTVALAPVSHLGEQASVIRSLSSTAFSPLVGIILRGVDIAQPSLGVENLLTDEAKALWPETLTNCLPDLGAATSWGGLPASAILKPDADLGPVIAFLNQNDAETLKIKSNVLVEQGLADQTVLKVFTDPLVVSLKSGGAHVTYKTYAGVDHGGIGTNAKSTGDALAFIRAHR